MIEATIKRLDDHVTELRSVKGAKDFTSLVEANAWPQGTPMAFVVPSALSGGKATAGSGSFTQSVTETISVILVMRPNDRFGGRGLGDIKDLRDNVIQHLAGWAPDDEIGVFEVANGRTMNVRGGALVYELNFRISDQVRILS